MQTSLLDRQLQKNKQIERTSQRNEIKVCSVVALYEGQRSEVQRGQCTEAAAVKGLWIAVFHGTRDVCKVKRAQRRHPEQQSLARAMHLRCESRYLPIAAKALQST